MCCLLATGKKRLTDFVSFPVLKNGVRRAYCIVLDICFICPLWSKQKIQGTYFKICQTYFKIQGTYFPAHENPTENCSKNTDKIWHHELCRAFFYLKQLVCIYILTGIIHFESTAFCRYLKRITIFLFKPIDLCTTSPLLYIKNLST